MAKLTGKKRSGLRKTQFVFPKQRAFPIDTENRARNALARCNQADPKKLGLKTSSQVCTRVQNAVDRKFPGIEVTKKKKKKKKHGK